MSFLFIDKESVCHLNQHLPSASLLPDLPHRNETAARPQTSNMIAEKFLKLAELELREDENRKKQSLQLFREWIKKHPFINSVRQGYDYKREFNSTLKHQFQTTLSCCNS